MRASGILRTGLFVVLAVPAGISLLGYSLKKCYDNIRNIKRNPIRNSIRLLATVGAMGGGVYSGMILGAMAGAALGSVFPVVGTALGALIGSVLGAIMLASVASSLTAFLSKHLLRGISYLQHRNNDETISKTNPEKYVFTEKKRLNGNYKKNHDITIRSKNISLCREIKNRIPSGPFWTDEYKLRKALNKAISGMKENSSYEESIAKFRIKATGDRYLKATSQDYSTVQQELNQLM